MAVGYLPDPDLLEGGGAGGGGGITAEADQILLVDSGSDNTVFLRRYVKNAAGAITAAVDTALDGTTAYTATGPVVPFGDGSGGAGAIEETRTINIPANAAVQNVTLTGVGSAPYKTIEVLQLDNTDELWVGIFNTSFTAAGQNNVNVVADGLNYAIFPCPDTLTDTAGNLTIPVLYATTGGRVQFWVRG